MPLQLSQGGPCLTSFAVVSWVSRGSVWRDDADEASPDLRLSLPGTMASLPISKVQLSRPIPGFAPFSHKHSDPELGGSSMSWPQ